MKAIPKSARYIAIGSIILSLVVLGLKVVAWQVTGSLALYSDALESIVNVVASFITYLALQWSAKPADTDHPYGHSKVEYLAAVTQGVAIIVAALMIFRAAWDGFLKPQAVESLQLGIWINSFAALLNGLWGWYLIKEGSKKQSAALRADGHHLLSDLLSSGAVLVGLIVAHFTGWSWLDPLMAAFVAVLILVSGSALVSDSVGALMDKAVPEEKLKTIRGVISAEAAGALEAHDLSTRQVGAITFIEFHLVVSGDISVSASHEICDRIEAAMRETLGSVRMTIHVEPEEKAKHRGIVVVG